MSVCVCVCVCACVCIYVCVYIRRFKFLLSACILKQCNNAIFSHSFQCKFRIVGVMTNIKRRRGGGGVCVGGGEELESAERCGVVIIIVSIVDEMLFRIRVIVEHIRSVALLAHLVLAVVLSERRSGRHCSECVSGGIHTVAVAVAGVAVAVESDAEQTQQAQQHHTAEHSRSTRLRRQQRVLQRRRRGGRRRGRGGAGGGGGGRSISSLPDRMRIQSVEAVVGLKVG